MNNKKMVGGAVWYSSTQALREDKKNDRNDRNNLFIFPETCSARKTLAKYKRPSRMDNAKVSKQAIKL